MHPADLHRLLENIVRLGTIAEVDHTQARARVQCGELLTTWLPWLTLRAGNDRTWWAPDPGEQVLVLSPGGDPAQAVILPALYQAAHPAPAYAGDLHRTGYQDGTVLEYDRGASRSRAIYPDGAVVEYDARAHALKATGIGTATITAVERITLHAPTLELIGDIEHYGNQTTTGDIAAKGDVADGTRSMAADRAIYNAHVHGGSPGPSMPQ